MIINPNTTARTGRQSGGRIQFSLRAACLTLTACAVVVWITVTVGFIPIVGALGGIFVGGMAGAVVGIPFRSSQRTCLVGAVSAVVAVEIAIAWLLCVLAWDLLSRHQQFPVVIPLKFVLRDWLHLAALTIALVAAVPIASVAGVSKRNNASLVVWPAFTCGVFAFVGEVLFFAFDVWSRGGFPQSPLPWPIALAIPLFTGTIAAAALGFVAGLIWLGIRSFLLNGNRKGLPTAKNQE